jgi:hypothetical protein
MALTLVATVGASNANSYATVADGNAYHESHLYAAVWNAATDERKAQGLAWATRVLDTHIEWDGYKATSTQALRWPRSGMEDADGECVASNVVPEVLKQATAELARHLLTSDPDAQAASLAAGAIKALKVGPIAIEYAEGASSESVLIPDVVLAMLSPFGAWRGSTVTLHRV